MINVARLLQLLRNKGDSPIQDLPDPRFDGGPPSDIPNGTGNALTPNELAIPSRVLPNGINPDEERIRSLFTQETPGMAALREHLKNTPTEDDPRYAPSVGRRILAILGGAGQELSTAFRGGQPDSRGGLAVAEDIYHEPYNKATREFDRKTKPLEAVASLDERRQGRQISAEATIEGMRSRKEQAQASLDERIRESNQRHEEALQKSKDTAEREKIMDEWRKERLDFQKQAHNDNLELRKDLATPITQVDPNDPSKNILVDRITHQKVGDASIAGGDRTIVSDANDVISGVHSLRQLVKDPNVRAKLGAIKGRGEQWLINLGASSDPDIIRVARELDTVEKKHTKLVGGTRSKAMIDDVRKGLGGIGQNPKGVDVSLDVMEGSANDTIKARGGNKSTGKKITLKDGTEVTVEE